MNRERRDESASINRNGAATSVADARDPDPRAQACWPPLLPPGFLAQPCSIYRDPTGRFAYTFNRVYGPDGPLGHGESTRALDEDRSYWCVSWEALGVAGYERAGGRSASYAMARGQPGRRLSFADFSSLSQMINELPGLLHVDDVGFPWGASRGYAEGPMVLRGALASTSLS